MYQLLGRVNKMTMAVVDDSNLQADSQPKMIGLVQGPTAA